MKNLYKIQWMYLFQKSSVVLLVVVWIGCIVFFLDRLQFFREKIDTFHSARIFLGDTDFLVEQVCIVFSIFVSHQAFLRKQDAFVVLLLAKNYKRSHIFISKCAILFGVVTLNVAFLLLAQRVVGLLGFQFFYEVAHGIEYYLSFYLVIYIYILYAILLAQVWDSLFGALSLFLLFLLSNLLEGNGVIIKVYRMLFPVAHIVSNSVVLICVQFIVLISCIFCVNMVIYNSKDIHQG